MGNPFAISRKSVIVTKCPHHSTIVFSYQLAFAVSPISVISLLGCYLRLLVFWSVTHAHR